MTKVEVELIYRVISIFIAFNSIGLLIGLISYLKRCAEDEEFY